MSRLRKRKSSKSPAPPSKKATSPALKTIEMSNNDDKEESEDEITSADNSDSELECA